MFVYKSKESLARVEPALRALLLKRVGKQDGHMLEISTWQGQDIHISQSTR